MKLSVKGLMFASGIGWGLIVLIVGVLNMIFTGYGEAYLNPAAGVFVWYEASGGVVDLIIGIIWALIVGGVCGIVFAWLYNAFTGKKAAPKRAAARRPAPKKKKAAPKKKKAAPKKKKAAPKKKKAAPKKKKAAPKKKKAAPKKKR
jgi:glycerol uptake facilitator-like aquaporin